jgi:hypothetical protein
MLGLCVFINPDFAIICLKTLISVTLKASLLVILLELFSLSKDSDKS